MLTPITTITQANDCTYFTIWDSTGNYNAVTNVGGWGTPNIAIADITSAQLEISINSYIDPITIELGGYGDTDFDALFSVNGFQLTSEALHGSGYDAIADGYYQIKMIYNTASASYSYTNNKASLCVVKCCVKKTTLELCKCQDDVRKNEDVSNAWRNLNGAIWAAECGQLNNFNKFLDWLNKFCENCGTSGITILSRGGCGCN